MQGRTTFLEGFFLGFEFFLANYRLRALDITNVRDNIVLVVGCASSVSLQSDVLVMQRVDGSSFL